MIHLPRAIRIVIVAVLIFSTSTVAICSPVVAREAAPRKAAASTTATCCCGTKDGKCCGMGCCMRKQSNQVPTDPPVRADRLKDASQPLGLVVVACDLNQIGHGSSNADPAIYFCGALAAGTLQSQHVRIQT